MSRTNIPSLAIHSVLLPTGKVLMFAYPDSRKIEDTNYSVAFVWDPVNDPTGAAIKEVDPPINPDTGKPYNLWCAGQTLLPNGDVLVAGGNKRYDAPTTPYTPFEGLNAVLTFNPFSETWTVQPRMAHGRWYPTLVKLPDGRVLIIGGYDETGSFITDPQTRQADPEAQHRRRGLHALAGQRRGGDDHPLRQRRPVHRALPAPVRGARRRAGRRPAGRGHHGRPGGRRLEEARDRPAGHR